MSDSSQGPGWWRASDGRWYPPETHPQYRPPPPPQAPPGPIAPFLPTQPSVPKRMWARYRSWPRWGQILVVLGVVGLILVGFASIGGGGKDQSVASDTPTSTSSTTTEPPTTTTTLAVPAGTDATVASITDGDSFKISNGTRVRLTGIDAPDTGNCLETEATDHLTLLIPTGTAIRLVYDVKRTDSTDRDLAYVYRLSDGLFINGAMVRDGYAKELKVAPNVAHAEEISSASTEARAAGIGIWASCSTSSSTTTAAGAGGSGTTSTKPSSTTSTSIG